MKIQYGNDFVQSLGMGENTTCVHKFISDENDDDNTYIIKHFIMHGLGLCIKVDSYVAHMLYACSFIHIKGVPIAIKNNKGFVSLDTYTTMFAWRYDNPNKK